MGDLNWPFWHTQEECDEMNKTLVDDMKNNMSKILWNNDHDTVQEILSRWEENTGIDLRLERDW